MGSRKLATYRAKRDFNRTAEPAGSRTVAALSGVTISSPDKVLWPDAGDGRPATKREFAEYLAAVGEWLLPHIAGRPCSLVRCPDGIGGQRFFGAPVSMPLTWAQALRPLLPAIRRLTGGARMPAAARQMFTERPVE